MINPLPLIAFAKDASSAGSSFFVIADDFPASSVMVSPHGGPTHTHLLSVCCTIGMGCFPSHSFMSGGLSRNLSASDTTPIASTMVAVTASGALEVMCWAIFDSVVSTPSVDNCAMASLMDRSTRLPFFDGRTFSPRFRFFGADSTPLLPLPCSVAFLSEALGWTSVAPPLALSGAVDPTLGAGLRVVFWLACLPNCSFSVSSFLTNRSW
mmetsp:Transcript_900/g.5623  ORF Transcript_900/g.5623 Transcript_900/m.5623 type:complete len:210 (-) Transcript_900:503-1132(-)